MRVLILGAGGREHALAWGFTRDPQVETITVAPGNGGTERVGRNVPWDGKSFERVHEIAEDVGATLIVPGSEDPLVAGLYDFCQERGLPAVGPSAAGARLEGSKRFGKEFCRDFALPTAPFKVFNEPDEAWEYIRDLGAPPVIKADGLAAGKGVVLPDSMPEARAAIAALMVERRFGHAGSQVVIEQRLAGFEASLMCACDGQTLTPIAYAMDYKRAGAGDSGPNTGGMGVLSPHPWLSSEDREAVRELIVERAELGIRQLKLDYVGILYIGLMFTSRGPQVIEFNCRWGDPETQGIVPRLKTPLGVLYRAMRERTLGELTIEVSDAAAVGVVLAAEGYPGEYAKGVPLDMLDDLERTPETLLFHAGTAYREGRLVSTGGRVACFVGLGESLEAARGRAYDALGTVRLPGLFHRPDIAAHLTHRPAPQEVSA